MKQRELLDKVMQVRFGFPPEPKNQGPAILQLFDYARICLYIDDLKATIDADTLHVDFDVNKRISVQLISDEDEKNIDYAVFDSDGDVIHASTSDLDTVKAVLKNAVLMEIDDNEEKKRDDSYADKNADDEGCLADIEWEEFWEESEIENKKKVR